MKKLIMLSIASISSMLFLSGCATYKVQDDGSVMTWGFFRNLAVKNTYYESGKLQSTDVKTESTTRDVMVGANDLIDTAANTYGKLKP
ncbi:MAG: hypothetical protein ACYC4Q_10420 [Victivallaceae bacterium]